jgi:hypothetical protein
VLPKLLRAFRQSTLQTPDRSNCGQIGERVKPSDCIEFGQLKVVFRHALGEEGITTHHGIASTLAPTVCPILLRAVHC